MKQKMENEVYLEIEEGEILDGDCDSPEYGEYGVLTEEKKSYNNTIGSNDCISSKNKTHFDTPSFQLEGYANENAINNYKLHHQTLNHVAPFYRAIDYNLDFLAFEEYVLNSAKSNYFGNNSKGYSNSYYNNHENGFDNLNKIGCRSLSGSAEDIMSQIDQVVCKKSYSNCRKRKSGDFKSKWEKFIERNNCVLEHHCDKNYLIKKKKRHCKYKLWSYDSSPERTDFKQPVKRKKSVHKKLKSKNHDDCCYENGGCAKSSKNDSVRNMSSKYVGDFDEVRKNLLEKLKKEEKMKFKMGNSNESLLGPEQINAQNSNASCEGLDKIHHEKLSEGNNLETEGDDEMNLTQLRLIALASNKRKQKLAEEDLPDKKKLMGVDNSDHSAIITNIIEPEENTMDDADKNELLLRAEALKTALLKKHQKRLNKLKANKVIELASSTGQDEAIVTANESKDSMETKEGEHIQLCENLERNSNDMPQENLAVPVEESNLACEQEKTKENVIADVENKETIYSGNKDVIKLCSKENNGSGKFRKKRKKPKVLSHIKENNGRAGHVADEDCQSLRSQLLCDLLKRKTSKFSYKKSILLDSVQRSAHNPVFKSDNKLVAADTKASFSITNSIRNFNSVQSTKFSTGLIPKPEIQRVIVHLGSDDSSDDDVGNESQQKENQNTFSEEKKTNENEVVSKVISQPKAPDDNHIKNMLILEKTRQPESAKDKTKEKKFSTEAIYKHLPLPQRLEYFRLKQKIAEREHERKKNKRLAETSKNTETKNPIPKELPEKNLTGSKPDEGKTSNPSEPLDKVNKNPDIKTPAVLSDTFQKAVPGRNSESFLTEVAPNSNSGLPVISSKNHAPTPKPAPPAQSNQSRIPSNQTLLTKLKFLLKKVKLEKTIEDNFDKEIEKLKAQIKLFEKKKSEQRFKIKRLVEESTKTYNLMQKSKNLETQKQNSTTSTPGVKLEAIKAPPGETIPKEANPLKIDDSKENQVCSTSVERENESQGALESSKVEEEKVMKDTTEREITDTAVAHQLEPFVRYNSPLDVFSRGLDKVERLDPNAIMCQFDFTGICRDEECSYQHFRAK